MALLKKRDARTLMPSMDPIDNARPLQPLSRRRLP
jgi:hypothetical protein